MAGRPGRQARPFALVAAVGLAAVLAGSAVAGPTPPVSSPPPAPGALPSGSVETPGRNELVSTPQVANGALGATPAALVEDQFGPPTISADGRYVVFLQLAGRRSGNQMMLRDRTLKTTTLIDESDSNGPLRHPTISADGRWVAYVRPQDGPTSILLVDRASGERFGLPRLPGRNNNPDQPALSGDGRFLALRTQVVEGTEVMLLDRATGEWDTISVDVKGQPTGFTSDFAAQPAISWDGRFVAFTAADTYAPFVLSPKPSNDYRQVFLRDRSAGNTTLLSLGPAGTQGRGPSMTPAISGDGSLVAFASTADDLVADDANRQIDVFAWSSSTGAVELVSRSTAGGQGNGGSGHPAVNGDGTQVAFASAATTLVPGDTTAGTGATSGLAVNNPFAILGDIFVRDRGAPRTTRVSMGRDNKSEADGFSTFPSISETGRYVAFSSLATNLVATDANKTIDVFVRDRPPRVEAGPNPVDFGSASLGSLGTTRPVTIRSTGITPALIGTIEVSGTNDGDFFVASNPCSDRTLAPGATCDVQVVFIGTAKGNRAATLAIASNAGKPVVLRLVGAVGIPKLTVKPTSGPPGLVVIATGTGFPPNAPVALRWSSGITATPLVPVVSDATGAFTAQVLILPRDRVGLRNLRAVASVPGLKVDPVTARFLVVQSTGQPPISGLVQVFAATPGDPIILRR